MSEKDFEERLIAIEMVLAIQEKYLDELNQVVIEQGKKIDSLSKLNKYLLTNIADSGVKPLEEETPPPHY